MNSHASSCFSGGVAAAIQLRAFAWRQDGNQDVLTPTRDIIMSPPIFANRFARP